MQLPATNCARARESVSAQLDGELSELELDRLETHLLVCPACTAWAEEVRDVTRRLREAALEEPAIGFALPRRGRTRATAPVALLAAAAASVLAVLGSFQSLTLGSSQPARPSRVSPQASTLAVTGLEVQRLGLDSLPARSPTDVVLQARLRAV